ncbi:hypothetical protein [Photobacterium sp. GB-72]|uniref:hypothetical protein n=1 Tax=Photobacterium sp. GB-72 TaxID=2022105 RepID=UPI000D171A9D|nr:hypothetical protein [Photobacterium sp. GB-72]PSV27626.1 hypothetical protein C9J40_20030 [Photobacterium sp. GB-72]
MWIYEHTTKRRLFKTPVIISYQTIGTESVQSYLRECYEKKYWLMCDCTTPPAIMFLRRQSKDGEIVLVNHSQFGSHGAECEFYSSVKGSPREINFNGALVSAGEKRHHVQLYRNFTSDIPSAASPSSASSNSEMRIDSFIRLVWQLFEDSLTQLADISQPSPSELISLLKVRDAGQQVILCKQENLKKHLYVDAKGFGLLKSNMKKAHRLNSSRRHQSVLLLFATHLEFRNESLRLTTYKGEVFYIDNVRRKNIKINRFDLYDTPCLVALSFCYESPESKPEDLICIKWFAQPFVNLKFPILVHSNYEKIVIDYAIHFLSNYPDIHNPCLYKPLSAIVDNRTQKEFIPSFTVSFSQANKTRRFALFLQETEIENVYPDDTQFSNTFDSIEILKLYEIQTVETLKYRIRMILEDAINRLNL